MLWPTFDNEISVKLVLAFTVGRQRKSVAIDELVKIRLLFEPRLFEFLPRKNYYKSFSLYMGIISVTWFFLWCHKMYLNSLKY